MFPAQFLIFRSAPQSVVGPELIALLSRKALDPDERKALVLRARFPRYRVWDSESRGRNHDNGFN